jgi:hypothetical protein
MVGPLSSEEIEDVVSSVRRLVSNEQRPRTLSRDLNVGRLLLTPALRVVTEPSPLAPLILDLPVSPASVDVSSEVPVSPDPLPDNATEIAVSDRLDQSEAVWEDVIWVEPEVSLSEIALAAEEAEVLTAPPVKATPDEVRPEDAPEPWSQVEAEWVEDEPIPFVPLRRRAENLAARLASRTVSEELRAEQGLEVDPPANAFAQASGSAAYEDDAPEEAAHDASEDDRAATERIPTEILDADGTPLTVLDEAALQEVVRMMIREELKGVLGERITRSVRKLVRAEINRALVARDLD